MTIPKQMIEAGAKAHVHYLSAVEGLLPGDPGYIGWDDLPIAMQDKCITGVKMVLEAALATMWSDDMENARQDGGELLVYRSDAGFFTAKFQNSYLLGDESNDPTGNPFWFSASGEDLSGDMFTHFIDPSIFPLPTPNEGQ